MPLLILDACVLIDYVESTPTILITIGAQVGSIVVARPVFEEVDQLTEAACARLGLTIIDPELDLIIDAASREGKLSAPDWVSLLLAKANAWTCVTNDAQLRKACQLEGVTVMWGLQLMLEAIGTGALSASEAIAIATQMQTNDPRFFPKSRLQDFANKARAIES